MNLHRALPVIAVAIALCACQSRDDAQAPAGSPSPQAPAPPTASTPAATPAPPAKPADATAAASPTWWQCGDTRVGATFDANAGNVALTFNGRGLTLPLARSGSGARYADEAGNEFWTKGAGGMLTLAGEDKQECTQAEGPSPWDAARARNVAFRAVGNEPGWLVEVGHGETPALHAQLDFGARTIDIAQAQPGKDGLSFSGQTASGTKVELRIERKECADVMSGARFEASAQLSAGGKTYRGCGAFLDR